jgi:hypothetical protein
MENVVKTEMQFTARATCPRDGDLIEIDVRLSLEKFVAVEDVLAAVTNLTREPIYQEDFTTSLLREVGGVSIITEGTHSGVKITCSA